MPPPEWFKPGREVVFHYGDGYGDYDGWLDLRKKTWFFICPAKGKEKSWEEELDDYTFHMFEKKKKKKMGSMIVEKEEKKKKKKKKLIKRGEGGTYEEGTDVCRKNSDGEVVDGVIVEVNKEMQSADAFLEDDDFDDDGECTYLVEWNDGSTEELGEDQIKSAVLLRKEEEKRLTKLADQKRMAKMDKEKTDVKEKKKTIAKEKEDMFAAISDNDTDDDSLGFASNGGKSQKKSAMPALTISNNYPTAKRSSSSISVPKKASRTTKKSKPNPLQLQMESGPKVSFPRASKSQKILNATGSPRKMNGTQEHPQLTVTSNKVSHKISSHTGAEQKSSRKSEKKRQDEMEKEQIKANAMRFRNELNNASYRGTKAIQQNQKDGKELPEQKYHDEHPYLATKRHELLQKVVIDPLQVYVNSSPMRVKSCLGVTHDEDGPYAGTATLMSADKSQLRKAIVQVIQNWIFFAHGTFKDDPRIEINPKGDNVFFTLNEKGQQDSVEFFIKQVTVGPTKQIAFNLVDKQEAYWFATHIWSVLIQLQSQLIAVKRDVLAKYSTFSDQSLSFTVDYVDPKALHSKASKKINQQYDLLSITYNDAIDNKPKSVRCWSTHLSMLGQTYERFAKDDPYMQRRLLRIFNVIARYTIFGKLTVGSQASISMETVSELADSFGCNYEAFASPLNRFWPGESYCSLFQDTDGYFGSRGSFYHQSLPKDGASYEINPPFDKESVLRCKSKMASLLEEGNTKKLPVACCTVFPFTRESFRQYIEDKHLKKFFVAARIMGKSNNAENQKTSQEKDIWATNRNVWFTQGQQHDFESGRYGSRGQEVGSHWEAEHPQIFMVFQNDEGRKKWPCTEDKLKVVVAAFTTRPSKDLFKLGKAHVETGKAREEYRLRKLNGGGQSSPRASGSQRSGKHKSSAPPVNEISIDLTKSSSSPRTKKINPPQVKNGEGRTPRIPAWFSGSPLQCYIFRCLHLKDAGTASVEKLLKSVKDEAVTKGWDEWDSRWDKEGPMPEILGGITDLLMGASKTSGAAASAAGDKHDGDFA
eukprot:CAMPEP_0118644172 /NCGR_PEP_ID=MMETSP0785-20121206/6792_1 /TAXON_ID=91992 /ORGANISM="Bolidomonas pacifica, Strain CCMP 1866" /LENGTH=1041 /DNA_ID=CAMNT_0006535903 /DNA_START=205 /DNA_END=3330 /DNA_ORIENTATION=+